MILLRIPDVGSGLSASFRTIQRRDVQIDCGGSSAAVAYNKGPATVRPESFILSHFHKDHYNGLLYAYPKNDHLWHQLECAYFPRLPDFPERTKFMFYLLSMNHFLLGDRTGSREAEFLAILAQLKGGDFAYKAVSAGDTVRVDGSHLEVLWPPRIIDPDAVPTAIRRAIEDFDTALEDDPILKETYERISDSELLTPYIDSGEKLRTWKWQNEAIDIEPIEHTTLRPSVAKANSSLKDAANCISLAFHEDNRLLFMGDLTSSQIQLVIKQLVDKGRENFAVCITPHHGTYWHDDIQKLHFHNAISSVGKNLVNKMQEGYKKVSEEHSCTFCNGDIQIILERPYLFFGNSCGWWHA